MVLIGLFLSSLKLSVVHAQAPSELCAELTQAVSTLYKSPDQAEPDILASIARTAHRARVCYGEKSTIRRIWLLEKETWALGLLGRYEEAEALVDLFYEQYAEVAPDEYRGHFAMHRFKFRSLRGDFTNAAIAFQEGQQFSHALPVERQVRHLLNGAILHRQFQSLPQALHIARQAESLTAGDSSLSLVHARALAAKSEILLAIEQEKAISDSLVLTDAIDDLERARSIFHTHQSWVRFLAATITLGRVYAALGEEDQAHAHFEQAMVQARDRGDTRSIILTHLRRGGVRLEQGALREAQADFTAGLALADTSGLREFELDLLLGLAETREAQQDLAEARRLYRRVIDAELPGVSVAEVKKARQEAETALLRVMLATEEQTVPAPWFWIVLLFSLALTAYVVYMRRRSAVVLQAILDPDPLAQGLLPSYEENLLLQQRLASIGHVLRDFPATLEAIDDAMLKKELAQGLSNNTDLFRCLAALEEKATGRAFENDPANTLGRYLRQEFKVRHIPWPQTPEAWRRMLETESFHEKKGYLPK